MLSWSFVCVKCWDDSEGCSYGQQAIGSSITTTWLLVHHVSCRVFWLNIWSPRWLRPPQPWFGALQLVDFPKTEIFWNGRDFRPSKRFRKIWQGRWWLLGELCKGPRCLLWRRLSCFVLVMVQWFLSLVSSMWLQMKFCSLALEEVFCVSSQFSLIDRNPPDFHSWMLSGFLPGFGTVDWGAQLGV